MKDLNLDKIIGIRNNCARHARMEFALIFQKDKFKSLRLLKNIILPVVIQKKKKKMINNIQVKKINRFRDWHS